MEMERKIGAADLTALLEVAISAEENDQVERAISLYKIGSELGDIECTIRLADALSEPPKFRDVKYAEQLYLSACAAGNPSACRNLAILYQQLGKHVEHDKYMDRAKVRGDIWQSDDSAS